jgi:ATP-dependent DNA helicase RecG
MKQQELKALLKELITTWENEVVEFKRADDNYSTDSIGKYFSALANEANLKNIEKAWLIFGIDDKTHKIISTNFRKESIRLQNIKQHIVENTQPKISFRNIYEYFTKDDERVILFEIPAAPKGMPISWKGHYYGRNGESLGALDLTKLDQIRKQTLATDWSAQIVANATIADLDETAIKKAYDIFTKEHINRFSAEEIASWSIEKFLDRAKLTIDGKITRTAILLLGKPESSAKISPHQAAITWKLEGQERAYEHFGPPFLLNTTAVYQKIRNIKIRLLPHNQLIAHEMLKYDEKIVLEALHNCIAHQDYDMNGRIIVTEKPDKLIFENVGSFFEGKPEDYILGEKTPCCYRNLFLVEAMVLLNMIDKMGYGIYDMNKHQTKRYLPLPDYDLSNANTLNPTVKMIVYGDFIDLAYSKILMEKTDLYLSEIIALDRVQKKLALSKEAIYNLKRKKLIEGRKPNFYVSAIVAEVTDKKAEYVRNRPQDDAHYIKLITDYIVKYKKVTRKEIDNLIKKHLNEILTEDQKVRKIHKFIIKMHKSGIIYNEGTRAKPIWRVCDTVNNKINKR